MDSSRMISRKHPATIACEERGIRSFESARVDLLKRGVSGSSVFRLRDEADRAAPIIAKYCPAATGTVERRVYEDILGGGNVAAARYYGWLAAKEDGFCWIFLGEVEGTMYSPRRVEHRNAAGCWLAALHSALRSAEEPADFPDRGPAHYRSLLTLLETRLSDAHLMECGRYERSVLEALRRQLDRIATGWGAIEAICERVPRSLVHGDFVTHNAYVRQEPGGPVLIPIDWEKAGWGTPAEDLSEIDLDAYWSMMAPQPTGSGREHYAQLARVGRKFRCLVFLEWAMPGIGAPVDERVWSHLQLCRSWLDDLA